jgi:DNA-binding CsgD family transcriptional regulator
MSATREENANGLSVAIPRAWQTFVRSGEYAGARVSIRNGASEVPVDLLARLEFVDDHRVAIHLARADGASPSGNERGRNHVGLLTPRERAVIALIAAGHETQDIAELLNVSPATVRTHVRNAMTKLGAHTRAQLVAVAMSGQDPVEIIRSADGDSFKSPN